MGRFKIYPTGDGTGQTDDEALHTGVGKVKTGRFANGKMRDRVKSLQRVTHTLYCGAVLLVGESRVEGDVERLEMAAPSEDLVCAIKDAGDDNSADITGEPGIVMQGGQEVRRL